MEPEADIDVIALVYQIIGNSQEKITTQLSALLSQLWSCEAVVKLDAIKLQIYKYSGHEWSFVKLTDQEVFGNLAK